MPSPSGSVPEATDAALVEPRRPQLDRAPVHVCEVRRVICGVSREYSAHRHHPVADPGVLLCTHGLRQLPDLLVSLVHGWLVDLVIKKLFCLTALQEAKLFVSVTLASVPLQLICETPLTPCDLHRMPGVRHQAALDSPLFWSPDLQRHETQAQLPRFQSLLLEEVTDFPARSRSQ